MEQMAYRVSQLPDIDIVRGITRPTGESLEQARLSFQAGEVGNPLNQAANAINSNTGNLNLLAFGADQIADVLGAVRGQLGQTLATVSYLVQALAFMQNQYGTGTGAAGVRTWAVIRSTPFTDSAAIWVSTPVTPSRRTTSRSPPFSTPSTATRSATPIRTVSPTRARLQSLADARNDGTLDQIADLCDLLEPTTRDPTALPAEQP